MSTTELKHPATPTGGDVEATASPAPHFHNTSITSLTWHSLSISLPDKPLLTSISGAAQPGTLTAILGPSGSGKTTLLTHLAGRPLPLKSPTIAGEIRLNNAPATRAAFRRVSCFVEQEEALIGSLTVAETLRFAAKLGLPRSVGAREREERVDEMVAAFGLRAQRDVIVGTPVRKGLSGGQKRRLAVAAQVVTGPSVLFLDEPTSGLDSVASYEVIRYLRDVARRTNMIVIASIHQPSTATFNLFDTIHLLSHGRTCFFGARTAIPAHFSALSLPLPLHTNPAEFLLDLVNTDFHTSGTPTTDLDHLTSSWAAHESASLPPPPPPTPDALLLPPASGPSAIQTPFILLHRNLLKSHRDIVAYGLRIAMYLGLALMMGTVWLRLPAHQSSIQPLTNAIFFGSAFMSFMAVAYVPAFLEDRAALVRERANGLYGPAAFLLANFLVGVPYLFLISLLFSAITYWLVNFRPGAQAFWVYTAWLFLDLLAAESLVVLISSALPIFVVALAVTAFANGLWMSVGGFLVSPEVLNVFWRSWARWIDYQAYVFEGMMVNEFAERRYACERTQDGGCWCMFDTPARADCEIDGRGVLQVYGYEEGKVARWVGVMLAITVVYRLLAYVVLVLRKT